MGCEQRVEHALTDLRGVAKAQADYPRRRATVVFDKSLVEAEEMCKALLSRGFVVTSIGKVSEKNVKTSVSPPIDAGERLGDDLVCYCFGYTRNDIEDDFLQNGRSLILEQITAEKRRGGCQCAVRNPKGR